MLSGPSKVLLVLGPRNGAHCKDWRSNKSNGQMYTVWFYTWCFNLLFFLTILTIPFSSDCLIEIKHQLILERCFNSTFVFVFTKYNICGKHVEGKIGWKIVMCDSTLIQILLVYHLPTNPPKTVTTYTHKINCSFNKKHIGFCITRWKTKIKLYPINPVVSITKTFFSF